MHDTCKVNCNIGVLKGNKFSSIFWCLPEIYLNFIVVDFIRKNINEMLHQEIMQVIVSYTDVAICYRCNGLATKSDNLLGGIRMSLLILYFITRHVQLILLQRQLTAIPVELIKLLSIFNFNMIVFCPVSNVEGPIYFKNSTPIGFFFCL
jgi:hypothetical protein